MSLNQIKLQATEASEVDSGGAVSSDITFSTPTLLFIGVAGNVKVKCSGGGDNIIFKNLPAGSILPVKVDKIYTASTTAQDVVALS